MHNHNSGEQPLMIEPRLGASLLSILAGFYGLAVVIYPFLPQGILEHEEWKIFILGWLLVPVLSLGFGLLFESIHKKFFQNNTFFFPLLLFFNSIYFVVSLGIWRWHNAPFTVCPSLRCQVELFSAQVPSFTNAKFLNSSVPQGVATKIILFYPIFIALAIGLAALVSFWFNEKIAGKISRFCYFLFSAFVGLGLCHFSTLNSTNYKLGLLAALLASAGVFLHPFLLRYQPTNKKIFTWVYAAVFFLTAFLVFDPAFSINHAHQNPVLAPISDLRLGKSLLLDTNCQYGVGLIYFLSFLFLFIPLSYQGLTLISMILWFLEYLLIFIVCRFLLRSPWMAMITFFLVILANFFATIGGEISAYPSLGPLRFIFGYLILLFVLLRLRFPQKQRIFSQAEAALVGMTSIWSFETFVYVIAAYGAVLLYKFFADAEPFKKRLVLFLKQGLNCVLYGFGFHLVVFLSIFIHTGHMPRWDYYFDYIFLYSTGGWGGMPIAPWTPWIFLAAIPLASFMGLVYFLRTKTPSQRPELVIVAGLSALGIAQMTYFIGRSHPNNIFHVCVPAIVLAAYWLVTAEDKKGSLRPLYRPFVFWSYFAAFLLILNLSPSLKEKLTARWPQYAHVMENFRRSPTCEETSEALVLINKYAKDQKRIALFIDQDAGTETLLLSGKAHLWPTNYAKQEEICPSASQRVLAYDPQLKEGDIIFVSKASSEFQQEIVHRLQRKFRFLVLEATPHQVFAIRLERL